MGAMVSTPSAVILVFVAPEDPQLRSILLLLLGMPIPIVILIAIFSH